MTRPAVILATSLFLAACGGSGAPVEDLATGTVVIETGEGAVEVAVSIAETPEARSQGLMNVEELGENAGMVFVQEEPTLGGFWMKDTLIPLSIAFWDEGGAIHSILDMEPCRADPCELYYPEANWVGALEVNQGFFEQNGVEVGDTATLER